MRTVAVTLGFCSPDVPSTVMNAIARGSPLKEEVRFKRDRNHAFPRPLLRLKAMGLKVILDTSGEALKHGWNAGPWLIKPNTEELSDALGADISSLASQVAAATRLHAQGVEHVVISQGAEGVNWFSHGPTWQALPPKVSVASTVGAGDSLLAGMLHGLLSGHSPEQTLRTATAIAAMAVTQIGFGISDRAQLATLERGVRVHPLTEEQEASS